MKAWDQSLCGTAPMHIRYIANCLLDGSKDNGGGGASLNCAISGLLQPPRSLTPPPHTQHFRL